MDVAVRYLVLICLLAPLLSGCQSGPDPSIELLESELRWMEDQLYDMDRAMTQNCRTLESCQRENAALRHELASAGAVRSPNRGSGRAAGRPASASDFSGPNRNSPQPRAGQNGSDGQPATPPAVDVPEFDEDQLQVPEVDLGPGNGYPEFQPDDDGINSAAREQLEVTRIVLNGRLTGGYDEDGRPGDEGLLLVIEPQNDQGQYVPLAGQLDISVYDPTRPGSLAQVARWRLTASEVLPLIKQTLLGRGIHLQMPWPNRPPASRDLAVQVEFQPPNRRRPLIASKEIRVDLVADHLPNQPEATVPGRRSLPMRLSGPLRYAPLPRPAHQLAQTVDLNPPSAPLIRGFGHQATGGPNSLATTMVGPEYAPQLQGNAPAIHQTPAYSTNAGQLYQVDQTPVWKPTRR